MTTTQVPKSFEGTYLDGILNYVTNTLNSKGEQDVLLSISSVGKGETLVHIQLSDAMAFMTILVSETYNTIRFGEEGVTFGMKFAHEGMDEQIKHLLLNASKARALNKLYNEQKEQASCVTGGGINDTPTLRQVLHDMCEKRDRYQELILALESYLPQQDNGVRIS